jgi:hypothetical protein
MLMVRPSGRGTVTACRFDGGYKVAFCSQIRFDEGCDIVHAWTICSGPPDSQRDREIGGREVFPESDQLIRNSVACAMRLSGGSTAGK